MTPNLVEKLNLNDMTEYGDKLLLGTATDINNMDTHTQAYLHHLDAITKIIPGHLNTISLKEYIK